MKTTSACLALIAAFSLSLGSASVSAHPEGHGKVNIPVSAEIARKLAAAQVSRLSLEGKVDKSWQNHATPQGAEVRTAKGHKEWVVTFQNTTEFDASKRTLYVFLTESGDYIAANFTGK
jgi:hypothetical protein